MAEPTITCPSCNVEIRLTESLAAPLIAATRKEFEHRLAEKESSIRAREETLSKEKEAFEDQVEKRLSAERKRIAEEESKKAKRAFGIDLERTAKELNETQELLKEREAKLAEAQKEQAEFKKKERELDEKLREADLTIETRISEGVIAVREKASKEAEEKLGLKMAEKDKTIEDMKRQLEEAKRRAEQSSQQHQGEVQEIVLERLLGEKFPHDAIEPVGKGIKGADVLHRVMGPLGQSCGSILWESKRTKNWGGDWLEKLRGDQRVARAEISVIVSQVLPPDVDSFQLVDGVWVVHWRFAIPLAIALRQTLVEVGLARSAQEGQQTKMELVYHYLTGPQFKQRVEAIVETFSSMQSDLNKEKAAVSRLWNKREKQIENVMQATVGMYGDLQGIAGKSLQEIEGLELGILEKLE